LTDIIGILSLCFTVLPRIEAKLNNYLKAKKAKKQIVDALKLRITDFQNSFNKVTDIPHEKVIPLLVSLEYRNATVFDIEEIRKGSTELYFAYSDWINSFISLAKGFKIIFETNPAFMDQLKTSDKFLYDFMFHMSLMYKKNHLVVDESFFLFTEMHKKKLKSLYKKTKEIDLTMEEAKKDIEIAKKKLVPLRNLPISKEITVRYLEAIKEIRRTNQKILISKDLSANLKDFVLPSLKPLMILLDQASLDKRSQA
jgi:hypothetical protein